MCISTLPACCANPQGCPAPTAKALVTLALRFGARSESGSDVHVVQQLAKAIQAAYSAGEAEVVAVYGMAVLHLILSHMLVWCRYAAMLLHLWFVQVTLSRRQLPCRG